LTFLGRKLAIAFPDTVLEEHDALREKTVKLGTIARACAIFGVDCIEVFRDPMGQSDSKLIKQVLEYLETPQYLRRSLFGLEDTLKYAGLLPPLRIPSHKPSVDVEALRIGDFREGVTLVDGGVNVGLEKQVRLSQRVEGGKRVTVRITQKNPLTGEIVERETPQEYWGYRVELKSAEEVIADKRFELKIATSRSGRSLKSVLGKLRESFGRTNGVMLIFGSPSRGLFEILGNNFFERVQFVINLFAEQHVETVRTEEAISAGLYLINSLSL